MEADEAMGRRAGVGGVRRPQMARPAWEYESALDLTPREIVEIVAGSLLLLFVIVGVAFLAALAS
jgi:hypothetical protein